MSAPLARRLGVGLLALTAAIIALAAGTYLLRTPERAQLDDAARAAAPGRFVGSSLGPTHFEVAGPDTGRVAVLVHGFSVPMYIWDSTFVALAGQGYRVIRYDLVGRGYSARADARYDVETFDVQLTELLDSLGVRGPVDLLGLSFGGLVTGYFAVEHPERVRTLTWIDPVVRAPTVPVAQRTRVLGRYAFEVIAAPGAAEGQPGDFLHPERFPGWADRYRPQQRFRGFARALHRSRIEMAHFDFAAMHGQLASQGTPLLLVWGREDTVVPIAQAEDVRGRIPSVEFVAVDSAGHLPHLERAAEVNAALFAFLARHAPAGAR